VGFFFNLAITANLTESRAINLQHFSTRRAFSIRVGVDLKSMRRSARRFIAMPLEHVAALAKPEV